MNPTMTMEEKQLCDVQTDGRDSRRLAPQGERPPYEDLDNRGRAAAARFLDRRGYDVIEVDWTCAAGCADIVAMDGEAIVFVEVLVRHAEDMGMPEERTDEKGRSRRERVAAMYLAGVDAVDVRVRFDVVSIVVISPDRAMMRHHIDALGQCDRCPCALSA